MSRPIARMGDRTSHGGTVISGDQTWTIYDKPVARIGDLTVCPKCGGTFPIVEGAPDLSGFGQAVARHGDKTACGAILIAGQSSAWWDQRSVSVPDEDSPTDLVAATKKVAQDVPTICLECLATAAAAGSALVVRS
ncbi:PAAR domain-containing protein [Pseudoduganella lurida]|uniref:PAAR domain-containing protein n=1 Tax=Pseudoduganella lurida TaxID=1036180 RepID=UPI00119F4BD2|nr:PAAR domain-containing protein [Pseudoduganella lurida]